MKSSIPLASAAVLLLSSCSVSEIPDEDYATAVRIEEDALEYGAEARLDTIWVRGNCSWTLSKGEGSEWLDVDTDSHINFSGRDESVPVVINMAPNVSDNGRSASFTIVSKDESRTVQISQAPMTLTSSYYYIPSYERLWPCPSASSVTELISSMKSDGSWSDVDYADRKDGDWSPTNHARRFRDIALYYHYTGNQLALKSALKAFDYWFEVKPSSDNWWNVQIQAPKTLSVGFVMLWDVLDSARKALAVEAMEASQLGLTAENKINLAWNVIARAYMTGDDDLLLEAREDILEEFRITEDEGIQKDWFYHMHGHMIQNGNYGKGAADNMISAIDFFKGTPLEVSGEYRTLTETFVSEGLLPPVWKGYYDFNCCGRKIDEDSQSSTASSILKIADKLGVQAQTPAGPRYYECSDYAIYRADSWYASVRMQSNRVVGFECTGNENMKGYFSSDGALLVRRDGDEYNNVTPAWNWKHVPGTTTYDDGKELWGVFGGGPYNLTDKVFGAVEGDGMVAAMDYVRDGLTCRKAWFFWKGGVVCVGAGITRQAQDEVVTTVEQSIWKGTSSEGDGWVSHNGITYISLDGSVLEKQPLPHTGSWRTAAPHLSDEPVTKDMFEVLIRHGKAPCDASYAYAVMMMGDAPEAAMNQASKHVRVIENTVDVQSVVAGDYLITVDWSSCSVSFEPAPKAEGSLTGFENEGFTSSASTFKW